MNRFSMRLSLVFSAGTIGGLANSISLWLFGALGITTGLGVGLAPSLTAQWLYPRLVWGGIWGILFLLPFLGRSVWARGLLYSLGPTLVQLFVVFPFKLGKGALGLQVGTLTPLFVIVVNVVWGVAAALWLRSTETPGGAS